MYSIRNIDFSLCCSYFFFAHSIASVLCISFCVCEREFSLPFHRPYAHFPFHRSICWVFPIVCNCSPRFQFGIGLVFDFFIFCSESCFLSQRFPVSMCNTICTMTSVFFPQKTFAPSYSLIFVAVATIVAYVYYQT